MTLSIAPPYLGQGIGKRLLLACERALHFYSAQGWRVLRSDELAEGSYVLMHYVG